MLTDQNANFVWKQKSGHIQVTASDICAPLTHLHVTNATLLELHKYTNE